MTTHIRNSDHRIAGLHGVAFETTAPLRVRTQLPCGCHAETEMNGGSGSGTCVHGHTWVFTGTRLEVARE